MMFHRASRELFFVLAGLTCVIILAFKFSDRCDCEERVMVKNTLWKGKITYEDVYKPQSISSLGLKPKENEIELPACPDRSPYVRKMNRKSIQTKSNPEALEKLFCQGPRGDFPPISSGGVYRPRDCRAKQRVAIIIPYRNRYDHLHIQLQNLYPLLQRQQADFRFFLVEQDLPTTFNQGMLFNIGFLEANTYDKFDCFIFSDVDLLPLNDECLYLCHDNTPFQLTAAISKWSYSLPYDTYYGGIIAFTKKQFEAINGFSNLYFGWGGVDDDLLSRVRAKKFGLVRNSKDVGRFDMIKHLRDKGNHANPDRGPLLGDAVRRQHAEGVANTQYTRTKVEILPLYTWIHVSINMTEVLKTAPARTQPLIKSMYKDAKKFDEMVRQVQKVNATSESN